MKRRKAVLRKEDKYFIYGFPFEPTIRRAFQVACAGGRAFVYQKLMDVWYPAVVPEKQYNVSVCAIFKDEAPYMKEWIEYHKIIGVDHFFLYNNFSTDHFRDVLEPYIKAGEVTLIDWPYKQGQMSAYADCVKKYKDKSRWIGFLDLDEFVVPLEDDTIYDFLKKFKNRGCVMIYWKLYGSAGKVQRNTDGLVTEDFTVAWKKHMDIGKCFFNTAYDFIPKFKKNGMMHHSMWTGCRGKALPPVNCFDRVYFDEMHPVRNGAFPIQINHYFTKSLDEYEQKKRKGDVYHKINPHDDSYFLWHEIRCGAVDVSAYKYLILLKKAMSDTNDRKGKFR